jgi:1-acyl-sn-glycerol-3-phosphate acyltransferase
MRAVNAIFVNRGEVDRKALREALATLKAGGVLGMAPEGTRSKTGGLQRGRSGAAYLAYHSGVKLLPAVSTGQEHVVSSLLRLRRARVRVTIGPAFEPPPVSGKITTAHLDSFAEEIMHRLAALLPPEYRGVYADVPVVNHSHQGA